ncbi:Serine/threonine-protein kinase, active site [Sesbania bispinosa]|nr:Serine/threonine-protein kinase, active site [Sesbania bispinosa]
MYPPLPNLKKNFKLKNLMTTLTDKFNPVDAVLVKIPLIFTSIGVQIPSQTYGAYVPSRYQGKCHSSCECSLKIACHHRVQRLNAEGKYLLDIKGRLFDIHNHLDNWNSSDSTPCGWKGVRCSTGINPVVESLDLHAMNLSGSLSPSIGGLVHLYHLNLSQNTLSGSIPREIGNCSSLQLLGLNNNRFEGQIPAETGRLSNLEELYLYNNKLSGPFPEEIGNLSSLSVLVAFTNNLNGSLPRSFGKLKSLKRFRAGQNMISGSLPQEIGGCESLEYLGLTQNQITGEIPKELGLLKNIQYLVLRENNLHGAIPKELGNCSNLVVLALYQNNLVEAIPKELGNLALLKRLYLYRNELTGNIPREIGNLSLAIEIDFSENLLTGDIPVELVKIKGLQLLHLFQNKLTGVIPHEVTSLKNLTELDLSINYLKGTIPVEFLNLTSLISLQLFNNSLSGTIPKALGANSPLWVLDLSSNYLVGRIPVHLCQHSNLMLLNLGSNKLTGNIPHGITSCKSLVYLRLFGNNLRGRFPSNLCKLVNLSAVELDQNDFTGPIPPQIGNCQNLQRLHLSNNHFMSELPKEIGNLSQLVTFNVSSNYLFGRVPPELFNCRNLQRLDLSHNYFIGALPVLIYLMRIPVDSIVPQQDIDGPHFPPVTDMYFFPKEELTFQDVVEATENFHSKYIIGKGGSGTVYRADISTGHAIAIKKLMSSSDSIHVNGCFRAEILTLGKVRHRNIVKLYGFCNYHGSNIILYEYMAKGSLGELLHGASSSLDWYSRFRIALGTAEGLSYLHHDCKPRIIHRDIKPNNILIDHEFEAHVGDFGLAKLIDMSRSKSVSAVVGSYGYIAPEYAYTMKVTEKCDVYSYGVVLLELLTGKKPIQSLDQGGDLVTWVRNQIYKYSLSLDIIDARLHLLDEIDVAQTFDVLKIALLCTDTSPSRRPTMRSVVSMLTSSSKRTEQTSFSTCQESSNMKG